MTEYLDSLATKAIQKEAGYLDANGKLTDKGLALVPLAARKTKYKKNKLSYLLSNI